MLTNKGASTTTDKIPLSQQLLFKVTKHQDFSGLTNRFSNLKIEETDDQAGITLYELSSTSAVGNGGQKSTKTKAIDIFEAEVDAAFDRVFQIFYFFEDLHTIQDFLYDTWGRLIGLAKLISFLLR